MVRRDMVRTPPLHRRPLAGLVVLLVLAACGSGGADAGGGSPGDTPASSPAERGATSTADSAAPAPAATATSEPGGALRAPPPPPEGWRPLIGEYVRDGDTVSVLEEGGELRLLRWSGGRRVARLVSDTALAVNGMDEPVIVQRRGGGAVDGLVVAGERYDALRFGPEGSTFRIDPVRPVGALREEALAASPPAEEGDFRASELVELVELDPTIRLDVRYAGTDNFMGARFYSTPRAFLQRPAAEALVRAHRWLRTQGYGVVVYDAYRPWHVTRMFWDATPDSLRGFVADPSGGSRHNRGSAVDLGLYDLETDEVVAMPSGYDEFSPRAAADYPGGTMRERWHRSLLRLAMEAEGFTVYEAEWWHFDHRDWRRYPIIDARFGELAEE